MAAKRSNRRSSHRSETTPRHLWLAGLGLLALARREAPVVAGRFASETVTAGSCALQLACDARDVARGAAMTVGEAIEARLQRNKPVRRKPRKTTRATGKRGATKRARKTVRRARA